MGKNMKNNKQFFYDRKADVLYLLVKKGKEEEVVEVSPGVNVELDGQGKLLGVEILNASAAVKPIISATKSHQDQSDYLYSTN
jgi:uncharacterized protein YuzE